jgi:hypothetical protein
LQLWQWMPCCFRILFESHPGVVIQDSLSNFDRRASLFASDIFPSKTQTMKEDGRPWGQSFVDVSLSWTFSALGNQLEAFVQHHGIQVWYRFTWPTFWVQEL